jgi:hypothetical protein
VIRIVLFLSNLGSIPERRYKIGHLKLLYSLRSRRSKQKRPHEACFPAQIQLPQTAFATSAVCGFLKNECLNVRQHNFCRLTKTMGQGKQGGSFEVGKQKAGKH